ncbi:MAG: hypothetical protein JSW55_10710 [Chloroflexota bacterium]|nr:MAG: hypothetical protein JSW55_10710 [Chloroflexota bacterium]
MQSTKGASDTQRGQPEFPSPVDFGHMLASLGSYQIEVNVSFEGQDAAGLPIAFLWRGLSTFASQGPGYMLELSAAGDEQPDGVRSMTLVRSGERSYLYLPGVGCVSGLSVNFAEDADLPLSPADLLDGLSLTEPVAEGAVVNGQVAKEFRFDEGALAWAAAGPWLIEGSAYLVEDSGLLTRTDMTVTGQGDLLADGQVLNGVYEVTIDVLDLEESLAVDAPAACIDTQRYPVTEDAFDLSAIDDLLTFKSLMPLAEVVDFYVAEMPAVGWQVLAEPDVIEDLAFLTFEKDGGQLTIAVEYDPEFEGVSVLISP